MKKWTAALFAAALIVVLAASALASETYYCTSRRLHIRRGPGTDYDIVGNVSYGEKVEVIVINHGWAMIDYDYKDDDDGYSYSGGWVSSKCISRTKPTGGYVPGSSSATSSEYRNFVSADYDVIVNPTNSYVNMRWEASKSSAVRRVYYYGARLHVVAENSYWCQVMDQSTGEVGFMLKSLLLRTYDTVPATAGSGAAENG